ncbi:MAG: sodium:calcium antiporter, partial [Litorimonas sp.]
MALLAPILLLVLGLVILVVAGDVLVRGAAALARHWGVPALIVGLTIVA